MRVSGDERLELADQRRVASRLEVVRDAGLQRGEPGLVELRCGGLREWLIGEVGERRPAPEREALAEPIGVRLGEPLEALDIELVGLDADEIAGRRVTIRSAPSALRSAWTCTCSAFGALAGGDSPQIPSISRSVETASFGWRSNWASSARGRRPPSGTGTPSPSSTSNGPNKRNSKP